MKNAATAAGACVVLHNVYETFGDHYLEDWERANDINGEDDTSGATHERHSGSRSAVAIRNAISQYLNNTN